MSEENQNTGKVKREPGNNEIRSCPLCGAPFEEALPLNVYNQCDPEEGCGETFRVVKK